MLSNRGRAGAVAVVAVALVAVTGTRIQGQGGTQPILVVTQDSATANPFDSYLPEILRAEGINSFNTLDLENVNAAALTNVRLVILPEIPISPGSGAGQADTFINFVNSGGRLIAMRPDTDLQPLLGISAAGGSTINGYASINQSGPGAGLQGGTLPFRGTADYYNLAGATQVAELYTNASTSAARPAVVRHTRTAAWAFDLALSTAYVRQGDPENAGLDRDGQDVYRTTDIFFQTIDLDRLGVPHADVQMRLFSRVIADLLAETTTQSGGVPLPRLWYFPDASRTVMILTGDSHTSNPATYAALIAGVESVGARISLYLSRFLDLSTSPVATWVDHGHEVAVHPYFEPDGLELNFPAGTPLRSTGSLVRPASASRPARRSATTVSNGAAGSIR